MGLNLFDHLLDTSHDCSKIYARGAYADTKLIGPLDIRHRFSRPNQRLAGDTARVQAIATHFCLFYQHYSGFDRSCDVSAY